jgi:hypothetical protein
MHAILSSRGAKIGDPGSRHPPAQPCHAILSSLLYPPCPEKESRPAQEVNMSSLYLRGKTWWAKSLENGRVVRWSLKTASRAEAKRRIKLYDSRPREEPLPSRLKGQTTWDVAGSERATRLLSSFRHEASPRGREGAPHMGPVLCWVAHHRYRCRSGHAVRGRAERSNCLRCQGAPRLIDRPRLGLPRRMMFHHGVEDRQQLAHTGRQGHLRRLAGGP